jgi:Family of unknown function (DUF5670)
MQLTVAEYHLDVRHSFIVLRCQRRGFILANILWIVVVVLFVLWLLGFLLVHITSGLIHLLLVIAVIILVYNLYVMFAGRRSGV